MANNRTAMDVYLTYKLTAHISAILEAYELGQGDAREAAEEIIEAVEQEMTWAAKPEAEGRVAPTLPPAIK